MPMRLAALPISGDFSPTDAKSAKTAGPNSSNAVNRRTLRGVAQKTDSTPQGRFEVDGPILTHHCEMA